MSTLYKKLCLRFLLLLVIFLAELNLNAQTIHQGLIWDINTPVTGNQSYQARDYVKLSPGFTFVPTSTENFNGKINESLVFNVEPHYFPIDEDRELNVNLAVGTIKGDLGTSSFGAATYTIPLITPPGTNAMMPALSLDYNSTSENGILGIGWNLSGLSSIKRTNSTFFSDGIVQSINMTMLDKFALDGNKLILTNGTYGADASQYHTEMESFSRITANGVNGNGPDWFLVETKDGKKMYYGNTTNSKVLIPGTNGVYNWLLNRVEDNQGNYIEFVYRTNQNSYYIDEIRYTGNSNAGLEPYNVFKFIYDTRTDINTIYTLGAEIKKDWLLTEIRISSEGNQTHRYKFDYFDNDFDQIQENTLIYSYLYQITEYGADNSNYNSTLFKYDFIEDGIAVNTTEGLGESSFPTPYEQLSGQSKQGAGTKIYVGDFNGDGWDDYITMNNSYTGVDHKPNGDPYSSVGKCVLKVILSSPNGNLTIFNQTFNRLTNSGGYVISDLKTGDFNGDGMDDIIFKRFNGDGTNMPSGNTNGTYNIFLLISTGVSFNVIDVSDPLSVLALGSFNFSNTDIQVADFNGDGKTEFLIATNLNTNDQTYKIVSYGNPATILVGHTYGNGTSPNKITYITSDFNSDGKAEIMVLWSNGCKIYDPYSSVNYEIYSSTSPNNGPGGFNSIYPGDFNGDGKTDLLMWDVVDHWKIYYFTGNSFVPLLAPNIGYQPTPYPEWGFNYYVKDFNGDGKSDIFEASPNYNITNTNNIGVWYSKGNNTFLPSISILSDNISSSNISYLHLGDFNGDGKMECSYNLYTQSTDLGLDHYPLYWDVETAGPAQMITFNANQKKRLITTIINGLNEKIEIDYKPLSYQEAIPPFHDVYHYLINHTLSGYPNTIKSICPTNYVVSSVKMQDGIGGFITKNYTYEDALFHKTKRRFLGFLKINESLSTGSLITTQNEFLNNIEILRLKETQKEKPIGTNIASSIVTNQFYNPYPGVYFPYATQVDFHDGLIDASYSTTFIYSPTDINYGNLTSKTVNYINENASDVTSYSYMTAGTWCPSKIQNVTIQKNRYNETSVSLKTDYDYYTSGNYKGLLHTTTNNPDLPNHLITTNTTYDLFGNSTQINISSADIESRTINGTYDTKGRYLATFTNPLTQVTTIDHENRYGNVTKVIDINGLETKMEYDGLGRLTKETQPNGIITTINIGWDINSTHNLDLFYQSVNQSTTSATMSPQITYFDYMGRVVQHSYKAFNGSDLFVDIDYNDKGQIERNSEPYYSSTPSGSIKWENYTYDSYNRLQTDISSSKSLSYSYNNLSTGKHSVTLTNTLTTKSTTNKINSLGQLYQVAESQGNSINYFYNSFDKAKQIDVIADATTTSTIIGYDDYGNQKTLTDPDAGLTNYTYNSLGELTYQKDARLNEYTLHYDKLGRILLKENTTEGNTSYIYDTETNGKGLLAHVTGANGIYYHYKYDNFSRLLRETEFIDGVTYNTDYHYDQFNNIDKLTYPSGFAISKNYNFNGYLNTITRVDDNSNSLIYQNEGINNIGQIEQYKYGNNIRTTKTFNNDDHIITSIEAKIINNPNSIINFTYSHDPNTKFISQRNDILANKGESFLYDSYDRLTTITGINGPPSSSMTYYNNGNINNNSNIGNYSYGENGAGVHAVTSIPVNPIIPQTLQNITYTSFNKVASISEDGKSMLFTYGPDQERKKTVFTKPDSPVITKYYLHDYETITTGSLTRKLHYISGSDGLAAIFEINNSTGNNLYYINKDHLGSIIGATDQNGNIISQATASFDAWGNRRDPATWQLYTTAPPELFFGRGFTGHEHLEMFGLINMNGRLYDPKLRRFLSPDIITQSPDYSQNYNKYSYCLNNPLNYIDPSGYEYDEDYNQGDEEGGGDPPWGAESVRWIPEYVQWYFGLDYACYISLQEVEVCADMVQNCGNDQIEITIDLPSIEEVKNDTQSGDSYSDEEDSYNEEQFDLNFDLDYQEQLIAESNEENNDQWYYITPIAGPAAEYWDKAGSGDYIGAGVALCFFAFDLFTWGESTELRSALNPAIKMTEKGLAHTLERHTINDIEKFASKSKFSNPNEVVDLIKQSTQSKMIPQGNGNFARIVDAGREIGIDRVSGKATSIYTVITNSKDELITAYPGLP